METQELVALKDVEKKDIHVLFNVGKDEFGYGFVYLTEDELYRSNQYQSRLSEGDFADFESLDKALADSKLYLGEGTTQLEAITQIFAFWLSKTPEELNVRKFETDADAVKSLILSKDSHLIYIL